MGARDELGGGGRENRMKGHVLLFLLCTLFVRVIIGICGAQLLILTLLVASQPGAARAAAAAAACKSTCIACCGIYLRAIVGLIV